MKARSYVTLLSAFCVALSVCIPAACADDIDLKKINIKLDLRKDSAYDARHTAHFAGSFPSQITKFDQSTSVVLDGAITDTNGAPVSASATKTPTKINKKGTRMQSWVKKYGASDQKSPCPTPHGNPIMRNVKLWANERKGIINYLISVNAKDKG